MYRIHYQARLLVISLLSIWLAMTQQSAYAQITLYQTCAAAEGGTRPDMENANNYINQTANMTAGLGEATAIPGGCTTGATAANADMWVSFTAESAGPIRIVYAPTTADDIALVLYRRGATNNCSDMVFELCADANAVGGTEIIDFNTPIDEGRYYLRIINKTDGTVNGTLSLMRTIFEDCLAAEAQTPIDMENAIITSQRFFMTNNVGSPYADEGVIVPPACGAITSVRDGWIRFRANGTGSMAFAYTPTTAGVDVALVLYSGTCGTPTTLDCSDQAGAGGAELVEVANTVNDGIYYLRVINKSGVDVDGTLSVTLNTINYDECGLADGGTLRDLEFSPLNNTAFNLVSSHTTQGLASCTGTNNKDAWMKFRANFTGRMVMSYNPSSDRNVVIQAFSGTCGSASLACGNVQVAGGLIPNTTNYSEAISFDVVDNTDYFVRVINITDNANVNGTLTAYQANPTGTLYNEICDADFSGGVLDLATTQVINTPYNLRASFTAQTSVAAPLCPVIPLPPIGKDGWLKIRANTTGSLVISYSPTTAQNIWLAAYDASNGCAPTTPPIQDNVLQCANQFGAGCTESITISAVAGAFYYLRIANTANSGVNGNLTIYPAPKTAADLLNDAQTITVGNCNVEFNVASNFYNNETREAFTCGVFSGTANIDGWLKVNLGLNERVNIAYTNTNKDAAIALYSGSCGTFTQVACANAIAGTGTELFEYSGAAGTYYIRVMNLTDDETMNGLACITRLIPRDGCLNAFNSTKLKTGDCNIQFDVLDNASFLPDPLAVAAGITNSATRRSAWAVYQPTATASVRFEYFSTNGVAYGYVIYDVTGTTPTDASNFCTNLTAPPAPTVILQGFNSPTFSTFGNASRDSNSDPYVAVDFIAQIGHTYFIAIISSATTTNAPTEPDTDLRGFACIYDNTKKAEDFLFSSDNFDPNKGEECGTRFNVNANFENLGEHLQGGTTIACSDDGFGFPAIPSNDAWANFDVTTLPSAGISIAYDNDNNDASVANDVTLQLYRGEQLTPLFAPTISTTCAAATLGASMTLDRKTSDITILDGAEGWFKFTAGSSPNATIRFEANADITGAFTIEVFTDCGITAIGAPLQDVNFRKKGWSSQANANPTDLIPGADYLVRITNTSGADVTGNIAIISNLVEVACFNNVLEGVETFTLSNSTIFPIDPITSLPYTKDNFRYYVRVANIATTPVTVTGTLCISNNSLNEGDLCSNAFGLQVGDCEINLNMDSRFSVLQSNLNDNGCGTGLQDVWVKFTAITEQTTFAYANTTTSATVNVALEAYAGKNGCGNLNLSFLSCVDAIPINTTGTERLSIATVPGDEYLVRIMNTAGVVNFNGNLCIYDTPQRDECTDGDLLTKQVGECNIQFDVPASFTLSEPFGLRNITGFADGDLTSAKIPAFSINQTGGSIIQTVTSSCDFDAGPLDGNAPLLFAPSLTSPNDICASAPVMDMNTSSILFTLDNDGAEAPTPDITCSPNAADVTGDNWVQFVATADDLVKGVTISFTHTDGDAALELYNLVTNCSDLNYITCDAITGSNGANVKSITYSSLTIGETYYVRVVNHGATQGVLAIYNRKKSRDGWIRILGNGNDVTLSYENSNALSNAALVVYTALQNVGPVTCGTGSNGVAYGTTTGGASLNQYACANNFTTGINTESATFKTNSGQIYIVRILDLVGNSGGMTGLLCISDGTQRYSEPCEARKIDIGDCGVSLDLINGDVTCGSTTDLAAIGYTAANTNYGQVFPDPITDCPDCQYGDVFARFVRPKVCSTSDAAAIAPGVAGANCIARGYKFNATTNKCECPDGTIRPDKQYRDITLQYDNRNGILEESPDVDMVIYRLPDTLACSDITQYRNIANNLTPITCSSTTITTTEGVESIFIAGLDTLTPGPNLSNNSGGEVFLMRIIRKTPNRTVFGKVCSFYGTSVASTLCPPLNELSDTGEYQDFTIPAKTPGFGITGSVPLNAEPTNTIPNCVLAGGSTPRSRNSFPVRSQAWTKFTAKDGQTAVTVQYDNTGFTPLRNIALAIYQSNAVSCANIPLIDPDACSNSVFIGAESVTFNVTPGTEYFIRVMNVHNIDNPNETSGRIRVFPYSPCQRGSELVQDGSFAEWPPIYETGNTSVGGSVIGEEQDNDNITNYNRQNNNIFRIPRIDAGSPYPNDLDMNQNYRANAAAAITFNSTATGIARFATDYGYVRESEVAANTLSGSGTYSALIANQGELNPEGLYLIRQSPWTLKSDWFGFAPLWSGYGGRTGGGVPQRSYCLAGGLGEGTQACIEIPIGANVQTLGGTFNTSTVGTSTEGLPEPIPTVSDANFMIVNGSFDPNTGLPPGKVWCQTIRRDPATVGNVGYFIFEVWTQNLISENRNLDVPQLRLTVCDMEDPNNPGSFPNERTLTDPILSPRLSRLPGVTDPRVNIGNDNLVQVAHYPRPPVNRIKSFLITSAPGGYQYGAAVPCNINAEMNTSLGLPVESRDARLKVLGSSFLVTEIPDKWALIRCVYRAPKEVTEMNICVENLSITKNGNDFGIDDISFRECQNPDIEAFERLLKGDPCELTDDPIGSSLPARLLTFSGKLLTDKVYLNWITITENMTIRYEVQRSINGNNFTPIGSVDAKAAAQGLNEYNFTDYNLPLGVSKLYYRLNFINSDGLSKLGPVIDVDINEVEAFELTLEPNPTNKGDETAVKFDAEIGTAGIVVADLTGRRLLSEQINTTKGKNTYLLNTKGLKAGIYIIKVINTYGQSVSKKLVVQ